MGWARGSDLFDEVIDVLLEHVPDWHERVGIYQRLVPAFEEADWDTMDECLGRDPAYDAAYAEMFPDDDLE